MVTAQTAPRLSAPSFVIELIARLCALVVFPVWHAARLAVGLALPLRFRRPLRASTDRGSSARYGADAAISDRTRLRSLRVSIDHVAPPPAVHDAHRVEHLPDVAWPITYPRPKTQHHGSYRASNRRTRPSTITLSHGRAAAEESPRWSLSADPHEARNSHQCEPARNAGRDHRGRPARRATRRPPGSPADGRRHLPR
jgi:hypothetical protein